MTPPVARPSDWSDFSARLRCFSEPCDASVCGGVHGWTIPYQEVHGGVSVPLWVYVTDLSQSVKFSRYLPLVVDTGSPITVIPREWFDDTSAFSRTDVALNEIIIGVGGSSVTGQRFPAALSVNPKRSDCEVLSFAPLEVFVADGEEVQGLLGMDALRQISTTFDSSQARLRRL